MKQTFILILASVISNFCYSQLLAGHWQGSFTTNLSGFEIGESPIELNFTIINDTSYKVFSYSNGENTQGGKVRVITKVYYKLISKDLIYLEETEDVEPLNIKPSCFQKMLLRIKKKKKQIILIGTWTTDPNNPIQNCISSGSIKFWRKI